ncbi:9702_t:CDS:1, partial [Entrophospora sp. SA101]
MEESRPAASELPCLFEALATKYPESLSLCGTKENQMWRFASGNAA